MFGNRSDSNIWRAWEILPLLDETWFLNCCDLSEVAAGFRLALPGTRFPCASPENRSVLRFLEALVLQAGDRQAQPVFQGLFQFQLMCMPFQAVYRFAEVIQRNEVTRDVFVPRLGWHQVGEQTLVAGMRARRIIEIEAAGRVLKNGCRFPGCAHAAAISALLKETQLEFQDFEHVAFVVRHGDLPGGATRMPSPPWQGSFSEGMYAGAVTVLRRRRDSSHGLG